MSEIDYNKLFTYLNLSSKGLDSGEKFDGSMVWDAIQNGEISKVAEYCKNDIELTKKIYDKMNFIN